MHVRRCFGSASLNFFSHRFVRGTHRLYCTKMSAQRILPNKFTSKFVSIECLKEEGFPAEIHPYTNWDMTNDEAFGHALALEGKNVFITGFHMSGKTRLAMKIANDIEAQGNKNVFCTAATRKGAFRIKGMFLFSFLGHRNSAQDMSRDQAEATMDRHARKAREKLFDSVPTLRMVDTLIVDDAHCVTLKFLEAMDAVARRMRPERAHEPFGGIQLIFLANFFKLDVSLDAGYSDFIYQSALWRSIFPPDQQVALRDFSEYGALVERAHFGLFQKEDALRLTEWGKTTDKLAQAEFVDDRRGSRATSQFYARHQYLTVFHKRFYFHSRNQFRVTEIGNILHLQGMLEAPALGLPSETTFIPGTVVQFNYGNNSTIEAGDIGVVKEAHQHCIVVTLPFKNDHTELVYAMRLTVCNPNYPDAFWTFAQFPMVPRANMSNFALELMHTPAKYVNVDPRWVLGQNMLGSTLSRLSAPVFQTEHIAEFLDRDHLVHEPTKVAFEELFQVEHNDTKRYCKNCKTNIATLNFAESHWRKCVHSARWCKECALLIPLKHWESHAERHTLVRCFDCRRVVEWRNWEIHRLSCPAVLKEISPDNPYIPEETRSLALAQGHDVKDLHS